MYFAFMLDTGQEHKEIIIFLLKMQNTQKQPGACDCQELQN